MLNFDHRPLQTMLSGSTVVGITLTVVSVSPSTVQRSNHLIHRNGTSTIQGPKAIKHKQTSHLSLIFYQVVYISSIKVRLGLKVSLSKFQWPQDKSKSIEEYFYDYIPNGNDARSNLTFEQNFFSDIVTVLRWCFYLNVYCY